MFAVLLIKNIIKSRNNRKKVVKTRQTEKSENADIAQNISKTSVFGAVIYVKELLYLLKAVTFHGVIDWRIACSCCPVYRRT